MYVNTSGITIEERFVNKPLRVQLRRYLIFLIVPRLSGTGSSAFAGLRQRCFCRGWVGFVRLGDSGNRNFPTDVYQYYNTPILGWIRAVWPHPGASYDLVYNFLKTLVDRKEENPRMHAA